MTTESNPTPTFIDPPWMSYARSKIGQHEIAGPQDNPFIVECLHDAGLPAEMLHDETAWCGSFANKCLKMTGLPGPKGPAAARSWARPCDALVQLKQPTHGCFLVYSRPPDPSHGHVGLWDATASAPDGFYATLGGNEDNQVKVKPYPKNRYLGSFWPASYPLPAGAELFTPEETPA